MTIWLQLSGFLSMILSSSMQVINQGLIKHFWRLRSRMNQKQQFAFEMTPAIKGTFRNIKIKSFMLSEPVQTNDPPNYHFQLILILINHSIIHYNQQHQGMSNFASPIKQLQTHKSSQLPSLSDQYEHEFWKIKAEKLDAENHSLKAELAEFSKKVKEIRSNEQNLKEKVLLLEDQSKVHSRYYPHFEKPSRYFETNENQHQANAEEVERLNKEIRILKNLQEIQMSQLQDQNRKLQRELKIVRQTSTSGDAQNNPMRKQLERVNLQNGQLQRKILQFEDQINLIKQQKSALFQDYQGIKKQWIAMRTQLQFADMAKYTTENQKPVRSKQLPNYEIDFNETFQTPRLNKNQQYLNLGFDSSQLKSREAFDQEMHEKLQLLHQKDLIITELQIQNSCLKSNHQGSQQQKLDLEKKQVTNSILVKQLEFTIEEQRQEISSMLHKLAPLLHKENHTESTSRSNRASLSLLEVFLRKYKIQVF